MLCNFSLNAYINHMRPVFIRGKKLFGMDSLEKDKANN